MYVHVVIPCNVVSQFLAMSLPVYKLHYWIALICTISQVYNTEASLINEDRSMVPPIIMLVQFHPRRGAAVTQHTSQLICYYGL